MYIYIIYIYIYFFFIESAIHPGTGSPAELVQEAPSLSAVRFNPGAVADTAPAEPLNLDSATRQLEQLVQDLLFSPLEIWASCMV